MITRRDFLEKSATTTAAITFLGKHSNVLAQETAAAQTPWYRHAWRRAVIDCHIPDWDERFLSRFDPDQYVAMLVKSRAQSIVCYAQSHVGLFNYPTGIGQQHRNLKGRDVVAELLERCHAKDIAVVLYTSVIHDRWASDQHPDWRMKHSDGREMGQGSRHGFVCPNSPYREVCQGLGTGNE